MATWTHTYREQAIPGANSSGIITEHRPGQKLAKAVTEIQERAVVDLNLYLDGIIDNGSNIANNTLNLRLKTQPPRGTTQTIFAVAGGEWPTLTVQSLEVRNGIIKNVGEGQELYPDKELYSGEIITSATLSYSNDKLTLTLTKNAVDAGLVVFDSETTEKLEVTILPPGGMQYQVLQRNAAGEAVWDYVRAVEVT